MKIEDLAFIIIGTLSVMWPFLGVWFGINLTSATHLTTTIAWGTFLSIWTLFTAIFLSLLIKALLRKAPKRTKEAPRA